MQVKRLLLSCSLFLCALASFGQGRDVPLGSTRTSDSNKVVGALKVDGVAILSAYATADSNDVLGFDSRGKGVLRKKGTGGSGGSTDTAGLSARIDARELLANKATNFNVLNNTLYPTTAAANTLLNVTTGILLDSIAITMKYRDTGIFCLTPYGASMLYYPLTNPDGYISAAVTSVTAGAGLDGGTITSTGTISMPNTGTAGTYGDATHYPAITTDAQGRVTAVTVYSVSASGGSNVVAGTGIAISTGGGFDTIKIAPVTMYTITPVQTFTVSASNGTLQRITLADNADTVYLSGFATAANVGKTFALKVVIDPSLTDPTLYWGTTVKVAYGGNGQPPINNADNAINYYYIKYDGEEIYVDYATNYK